MCDERARGACLCVCEQALVDYSTAHAHPSIFHHPFIYSIGSATRKYEYAKGGNRCNVDDPVTLNGKPEKVQKPS